MKSTVQTAIAALAAVASFSAFASAKEPLAVGANPEAMTRGFGGKLYVSIMGETRTEGDGNGGITVIEDGVPKVFCDGMDDPKGIVMLGDFLVTTDFKKLWKIDKEGKKDVLADGTIRVAEFFKGNILQREGDGWKSIATGHRSADGIVHDGKGRFFVSEVKTGRVTRYEADGSGQTELGKDLGLQSAADLFLDEEKGMLIVPDTKAGKLFFIGL